MMSCLVWYGMLLVRSSMYFLYFCVWLCLRLYMCTCMRACLHARMFACTVKALSKLINFVNFSQLDGVELHRGVTPFLYHAYSGKEIILDYKHH